MKDESKTLIRRGLFEGGWFGGSGHRSWVVYTKAAETAHCCTLSIANEMAEVVGRIILAQVPKMEFTVSVVGHVHL